jgi:multidrug efflux system membrane fusion protein
MTRRATVLVAIALVAVGAAVVAWLDPGGHVAAWRGTTPQAAGAVGEGKAGKGARDPARAGKSGGPGGGRRGARGGPDGDKPIPVQAAAVRAGDLDLTLNALGTVTARNTVTVRSRVDGQLLRIAFREGQAVRAGDLLAEIDPRPFEVQLEQMNGQLARDQALLANAKVDVERYRGLLAKDSIAKQQVDAQEALVRQYEGTVQADIGQVNNARLQLAYARITAPISGRLGLRLVDVGNMVRAGDANGIVVITETQPITAVFSIPADSLPAVVARLAAGAQLPVQAWDRDARRKLATGRLLTVDNQIDASTGTVKLKAEFANDDQQLFPNQFINARLQVDSRKGVLMMPASAMQRGADGAFVYRIADGQATIRPVTLGPASGDMIAVESGLAAGDLVVVDGADRIRGGAKVEVIDAGARPGPAGTSGSP